MWRILHVCYVRKLRKYKEFDENVLNYVPTDIYSNYRDAERGFISIYESDDESEGHIMKGRWREGHLEVYVEFEGPLKALSMWHLMMSSPFMLYAVAPDDTRFKVTGRILS